MGDIAAYRKLPPLPALHVARRGRAVRGRAAGGGGYEMLIKLQLLPGEEVAAVREKLVPAWMTFGLTTKLDEPRFRPCRQPSRPSCLPGG